MNFITVATLFTDNSNDVVFWGLMVSPTASRENTMYCFRRDNRNSIPLSRPCQTRATLHALVPVTRFAYPAAMWFPHTHPSTHTHIRTHGFRHGVREKINYIYILLPVTRLRCPFDEDRRLRDIRISMKNWSSTSKNTLLVFHKGSFGCAICEE